MKNNLYRIVSIIQICGLLTDPCFAIGVPADIQRPSSWEHLSTFQEEALALNSVAQRQIPFHPFLSFSTVLESSQSPSQSVDTSEVISPQFFGAKLDANIVGTYSRENPEGYFSETPIVREEPYTLEQSKALAHQLAELAKVKAVSSGMTFDDESGHTYRVFHHQRFGHKPIILDERFYQQMIQHLGADRVEHHIFIESLVDAMEMRGNGKDLFDHLNTTDISAYVVVLLDASQSLFENHHPQGVIGINKILFDKMGLLAKNAKKTAGGARSTRESELEKLLEDQLNASTPRVELLLLLIKLLR